MKPVVKIGCSAVLSAEPDEAIHGRHIAQAVALAVEQANAQNSLPFTVALVVDDDQARPEAAVAVARRFIADPALLGVVGTMNSHTSLATAPLYSAANLTQISPAASNPSLSQQGFHTFFRLVPPDLQQGRAAAGYAVQVLGAQRVAVIHDGGAFGQPLAEIFAETAVALGAQLVCECQIESGQVTFAGTAAEVVAAGPDLIFMGVIEAEGRHLARQLRQAGVTAPYFGTDGLKPSLFLATPDYPVSGPYHTSAATDVFRQPSAAAFAAAYRERYGELYSIYTAEAYDAANLLIAAAERADRLERAAVLTEVARIHAFAGASGPITFDPFGERLDPQIGIYQVIDNQAQFLGFSQTLLRQPN